jgi:dolichol-phosphate mannosyltransferase
MSRMLLSVVIPAYNEEQSLPATLAELQEALDRKAIPHEIVVVNDNSTDGTAEVLRASSARDPRIRAVTRRPPGGFGRAVRSGLAAATGEAIVICMADCSDAPEDVVAYYQKLEEGYDCVFGSRFIKGGSVENYPRLKRVVNRIVNKCIQWLFWCRFNDLTNAFKAYRADVIRACGPFQASHFNITIEMSLAALIRHYQIVQVPIRWRGRVSGVSKMRIKEMGRRYFSTLLKAMAERFLIADDVIAERLAAHGASRDGLAKLEARVAALEQQVGVGARPTPDSPPAAATPASPSTGQQP